MAAAVTINPYALITADDIKDYIGSTSQADKDRQHFAINSVTAMIESFCGRKFKSRKHWNEIHRNVKEVVLRNYPILSIESVYDFDGDIITASGTVDSGSTTTLVDNALTQADDYWNGAELSVEIATNLWEKRVVDDFVASSDTISVATNDAFTATTASKAYRLLQYERLGSAYTDNEYMARDYDKGILYLGGSSSVIVNYIGGYAQIPDDLKQAAVLLALEFLKPEKNAALVGVQLANVNRQFVQPGDAPDMVIKQAGMILNRYRSNPVVGV